MFTLHLIHIYIYIYSFLPLPGIIHADFPGCTNNLFLKRAILNRHIQDSIKILF